MLYLHARGRVAGARRRTLPQIVHFFVTLLVLTSLILPGSTVVLAAPSMAPSTAPSTMSGPCTAAASAEAAIVLPASPAAPITIPKSVVDDAVYSANWRFSLTDSEAVESLVQALFVMAGAGAQLPQFVQKVRQVIPLDELNDRVVHPLDELVYVYFDEALATPALLPFVPTAWEILNAAIPRDDVADDSALLIAQSAQRIDLGERMLLSAQEYLTDLHTCARTVAAVASQFDALNGQALGVNIRDGASTVLQKKADLELPATLVQGIQPNGTALLSLDQLNGVGAVALGDLDTTLDEMLDAAKQIDAQQTLIIDFLTNQQKKDAAKQLATAKAAETAEQFKKAESAISTVASILSKVDPVLAKQFKVMTSSYLEVVKSVNTWLEATAGLGTLDKIFSFSTATMTGNIVGAVMNIVGLFGESKPTPEQQILEQIGKLRQQVNQLRQEMHARFDRIDAQLNAIFTTMQERFDQVDVQLGEINGNVRDVQRSLIELDLKLSQFERNNFELLNVLGRRPLLDAINAGLDYQRVTGTPMPFQPEFIDFERTFHTWGTVHAFDPLNTGPSQRDYSDAALYHELTTYPLDTNINYLNGWLAAHGKPPIATGMLASPRDWLLASRAYTQLGAEWPEHMARINASELTELLAVGQQLEAAIARITAPTVAASGVTTTTESIFDVVAALYSGKMTQLDAGLQGIENTWLGEIQADLLDTAVPFDLFGGPVQVLHPSAGSGDLWYPPGYSRIELEDPNLFVPVILSVAASIQALVAAEHRQLLAELLNLGGSTSRITMTVVEDNQSNFPCLPPLKPKDCVTSAHEVVTVQLHFGSVVWKTLVWDMGQIVRGRLETAQEYVARVWESKKAEFDANAVTVPPTPDEQLLIDSKFANLKGALDARLEDYQQILYARFVDQMSTGTLHSLMVEIAGAKALLDAFTNLGLPRAVASDEFLHAMLFGEQRIFDDVLIIDTFALSATQPITDTSLLVNQRPLMMDRSAARVAAYISIVDGYLAAIAAGESPTAVGVSSVTAGGYAEGADYLASTGRLLDLTVRIARVTQPQTPGQLRQYLPFVDR